MVAIIPLSKPGRVTYLGVGGRSWTEEERWERGGNIVTWLLESVDAGTLWVCRCLRLIIFVKGHVYGFSYFPRDLPPLAPSLLMKASLFGWLVMNSFSSQKNIWWYLHLLSTVIFLLLQMTPRQLLGWLQDNAPSCITHRKLLFILCPQRLWTEGCSGKPLHFAFCHQNS